jgi:hypothetical protein
MDARLTAENSRVGGEGLTLHPFRADRPRRRLAAILAARKLAQYDGGKRVPATVAAISDAVRWAEEIMREIDRKYADPTRRAG